MPPWMIGCSIPNISVMAVFMALFLPVALQVRRGLRRFAGVASVSSVGQCRCDIGRSEIFALEQQGHAARFRQRIGEQIAEIELRAMAVALAVTKKGLMGCISLFPVNGDDLNTIGFER